MFPHALFLQAPAVIFIKYLITWAANNSAVFVTALQSNLYMKMQAK